mmetsp:Transcript_9258/g.34245  ORF Transcript_9258/g.34245 Transcript_9258/m.34245 type:complete len:286 (+) Transcript_9258:1756-2613(+)
MSDFRANLRTKSVLAQRNHHTRWNNTQHSESRLITTLFMTQSSSFSSSGATSHAPHHEYFPVPSSANSEESIITQQIILHLLHLFDEKKYDNAIEYLRRESSKCSLSSSASRRNLRKALEFEGNFRNYSRQELIQRQFCIAECFRVIQMRRRHLEFWFEATETRFLMATEQDNAGNMLAEQEKLLREYVVLADACFNYDFFLQSAHCHDRLISLVKIMRNNFIWMNSREQTTKESNFVDDSETMVRIFYAMKAKALRCVKDPDDKVVREARAAELSGSGKEKITF